MKHEHDTIHPPSFPAAEDPTFPGAPAWALDVVDEMRRTRNELTSAMAHFGGAAQQLARQNRELIANQASLRGAFEHLRHEVRSRTNAHDAELDDLRERLLRLEEEVSHHMPGSELQHETRQLHKDMVALQKRLDRIEVSLQMEQPRSG